MADQAHILQLPPELCVRVADYLTTAELSPLRRSCKQIEANLFDSFASEFFTKRQFMIEHVSLEALVGIANHPGLAAKLSEVIISDHAFIHMDPVHGFLSRDVLLSTGLALDMLADAFSKLSNLKTVGLRDYDGAGRDRDGQGARWRSWGWSYSEEPPRHASTTSLLPMILSALGKSKSMPQNVQVILRHNHLQPASFSLPNANFGAEIVPVLRNLKSLFLVVMNDELHDSASPWNQYDDQNPHELSLRRFLHHTSQLDHLRINFWEHDFLAYRFLNWLGRGQPANATAVDLASSVIPPAPLPNLTTLDIGMAVVSEPTLLQLLCKFDLASFSLWKIALQCPGPVDQSDAWAEFLLKLSTSLPSSTRIKSIMIGEVRQIWWKPIHHQADWAQTLFVPSGTDVDNKFDATSTRKVEFKGQYTAQTANSWLQDLATRTFVPGFHVNPKRQRGHHVHQISDTDDTDEYEDDEDGEEDDEADADMDDD